MSNRDGIGERVNASGLSTSASAHDSYQDKSSTDSDPNVRLALLADSILQHDSEAFSHWLQIGRQLIEAKNLLPHGTFGAWCRSELKFSASKALKLMQGAEIFGSRLEFVTVTNLPSPTLIYLLAAPSCPQEIFNAFSDRVVAGEQVGSDLRKALRQYRAASKQKKNLRVKIPAEEQADEQPGKAQQAAISFSGQMSESRDYHVTQQQFEVRRATIAFLVERLGDELSTLLFYAAQAGPGRILSLDVQRELQAHLPAEVASVSKDGIAPPETPPPLTEVSSEAQAAMAAAEVGGPVPSSPRAGS